MRILVTGSQGCIGRSLVRELRSRGHQVWGCDLYHAATPEYTRCDIRHFRQVERLFGQHEFDYVYNLAA